MISTFWLQWNYRGWIWVLETIAFKDVWFDWLVFIIYILILKLRLLVTWAINNLLDIIFEQINRSFYFRVSVADFCYLQTIWLFSSADIINEYVSVTLLIISQITINQFKFFFYKIPVFVFAIGFLIILLIRPIYTEVFTQ